jgi:aminomethyltransferase
MKMGGKPITDYAPDFWLIQDPDEAARIGYVTSPFWNPELEINIALGFVPWSYTEEGTRLAVELPERYTDRSGAPVMAEVCDVPFKPSVNPSARERAMVQGSDAAE